MSNHTLTSLTQELAESRAEFLRNIPNFSSPQREQLTSQFFATEQLYLGLIANFLIRQAPLTINIPFDMSALTPVLTTPTAEQVATEVQDYMHSSIQQCAICQDDISSDGSRLRVCQHSFHRACIQTWFHASVRCPVCRRDIREDPAAQTSSASTGISFQEQNQWGGEDIEE
jgi:hypothetical protein